MAHTSLIAYFFVFIGVTVACHFLGRLVYGLKGQRSTAQFFFETTLLGFLLAASSVSIVLSHGRTISWLIVAAMVLFVFISRREPARISPAINPFKWWMAVATLLFSFAWFFTVVLDAQVIGLERDNVYYADVSQTLVETGWENTNGLSNYYDSEYQIMTPYHYVELWFNGAIGKIFDLHPTLVLYLVTYPFLCTLCILGMLSMCEKRSSVTSLNWFLALLLLFVGGYYQVKHVLGFTELDARLENGMALFGSKLMPVMVVALLALEFWYVREWRNTALLVLCALPAFNISFATGVYPVVLCLLLWKMIYRRDFTGTNWILMGFIAVSGVVIYMMYRPDEASLNHRLHQPVFYFSDLPYFSWFNLKFFLVEWVLKVYPQPIFFLLNYGPYVLIILLLWKLIPDRRLLLSFLLVAYAMGLSGLAFSKAFYKMDNGHQLYSNVLILVHAALAGIILVSIPVKKFSFWTGTLVLSVILLQSVNAAASWYSHRYAARSYRHVAREYVDEVNRLCDTLSRPSFGLIFPDKVFYADTMITYPQEYYEMPFIYNPFIRTPFNVSLLADIGKSNPSHRDHNVGPSPFTSFVRTHDEHDTSVRYVEFAKRVRARYAIVFSAEQENLFKAKTIGRAEDRQTGQVFLLLKQGL